MTCDRCGTETSIHIMSMFNTETICGPCSDREQAHPLYEHARRVEAAHVARGDFQFRGVGVPPDLLAPPKASKFSYPERELG